MSQIVIAFERTWLDQRRAEGVRVVRALEKWVADVDGVVLKSSTGNSLTLEMKSSDRESFVKRLAERMRELGEDAEWKHTTFSGDVSGLDLPKQKSAPAAPSTPPAAPSPLPTDTEASPPSTEAEKPTTKDGDAAESAADPSETLKEICGKVPIKHSKELEKYVREIAAVIPTLQRMGVEHTLWHQHLLLAVEAGYGRSEFLASLAKLYKAFGLIKGEIDGKTVREYILLEKGRECSLTV